MSHEITEYRLSKYNMILRRHLWNSFDSYARYFLLTKLQNFYHSQNPRKCQLWKMCTSLVPRNHRIRLPKYNLEKASVKFFRQLRKVFSSQEITESLPSPQKIQHVKKLWKNGLKENFNSENVTKFDILDLWIKE